MARPAERRRGATGKAAVYPADAGIEAPGRAPEPAPAGVKRPGIAPRAELPRSNALRHVSLRRPGPRHPSPLCRSPGLRRDGGGRGAKLTADRSGCAGRSAERASLLPGAEIRPASRPPRAGGGPAAPVPRLPAGSAPARPFSRTPAAMMPQRLQKQALLPGQCDPRSCLRLPSAPRSTAPTHCAAPRSFPHTPARCCVTDARAAALRCRTRTSLATEILAPRGAMTSSAPGAGDNPLPRSCRARQPQAGGIALIAGAILLGFAEPRGGGTTPPLETRRPDPRRSNRYPPPAPSAPGCRAQFRWKWSG